MAVQSHFRKIVKPKRLAVSTDLSGTLEFTGHATSILFTVNQSVAISVLTKTAHLVEGQQVIIRNEAANDVLIAAGLMDDSVQIDIENGSTAILEYKSGKFEILGGTANVDSFSSITTDTGTSPAAESFNDVLIITSSVGMIGVDGDSATNTINLSLVDSSITEAKLDINNAPSDAQILSWNNSAGKPEWINQQVFGTEEHYAETLAESATTSTTPVEVDNITTGTVPAGDYHISWSGEQMTDKGTIGVALQVQVDNTTTLVGGTVRSMQAASEWFPFGGHAEVTLTNASHTIDFDHYAGAGSGGGSRIKNLRLDFWRVS